MYFVKVTRKGSCMSCGHDVIRLIDSDGSEFCSRRCVKEWHGIDTRDINVVTKEMK